MEKQIVELRNDILSWYDVHKRELPWREHNDSYAIWVSEIMLQQTRVEAVKPYFARFMKKYPTITDLSRATEDDLHKVWEGLGYYRRVMNMKKCAQVCVELYQGKLPSTYKELLSLPGIGSYTAGAIASIAFNEPVPAVDGNVLRVFSRIFESYEDIMKEKTKKIFFEKLLPYVCERPSEVNQAIMDVGATICVPNAAPRCNICPLQPYCKAYEKGLLHVLPVKSKLKKRKIEDRTIVLVVCEEKIKLEKRPSSGLLAGLYEYVNLEGKKKEEDIKAMFQTYHVQTIESIGSAKHIFSHIEWKMEGYIVHVKDVDDTFISYKDLKKNYAIPTAFQYYTKFLESIMEDL